MSDTLPSTIRFGSLEADAIEPGSTGATPAPVEAADPLADLAMLLHIVGHILEREQARYERHAVERSTLTERLLLLEEQVAALLVMEHRR